MGRSHDRQLRVRRAALPGWVPAFAAVVVYFLVGAALYWPMWPGESARIAQCTCGDPGQYTSFLAWIPYAITHGLNPFFTTRLNAPYGMNLAANTDMPLLGLITAPVTLAFGSLSSLSLLLWLSLPLSATSMFVVLRRWTVSVPAAFVGGLLYGISPYMTAQLRPAHLDLVFVPLPPVIALAALELFVLQRGNPRRWGVLLGCSVAAQLLVSTEIMAITGLTIVMAMVVIAVAHRRRVGASLRFTMRGLPWTAGIVAAGFGFPLWMSLAGPMHTAPPPLALLRATPFRTDLAGPFVPTAADQVGPAAWKTFGDHLVRLGHYSENGSYIGIPLLLFLTYTLIRSGRDRWIRLCLVVALAAFVLSLGPELYAGSHHTGVVLPFAGLQLLPLSDLILPARFSFVIDFLLAVVVALGLDRMRARYRPRDVAPVPSSRTSGVTRAPPEVPRRLEAVAAVALVACSVASFFPSLPDRTEPSRVPRYFTSADAKRIPVGGTVLAYPYAMPGDSQPMAWLAAARMRYALMGGYGFVPGKHAIMTPYPTPLRPSTVQSFFAGQAGESSFPGPPATPASAAVVGDLRTFLRRYDVGTVLVDDSTRHAGVVEVALTQALHVAPATEGGVAAWYHVQRDLADT